jgi:hypothetical protein
MRSILVGCAVIASVVCGISSVMAAPTAAGIPTFDERVVVLAQAQSSSRRTTKQRRPARRPSSPASAGSNPPAASDSKGFDPKKIWESD